MCHEENDAAAGLSAEAGARPYDDLRPIPERLVPIDPEWWRCLRIGGISGRYDGTNGKTGSSAYALDLRVDIDQRLANSPVMNKVSGDFYKVQSLMIPLPLPAPGPGPGPIPGPVKPRTWRVYKESWIIDSPVVKRSRCKAVITGNVRFWKGVHLLTTAEITITWGASAPTTAVAKFTAFGSTETYTCTRISDCFRSMNMEIDVCNSVNAEPILPTYNTGWLADRPADTPIRDLTIEQCYRETGVEVTMRADRTIVEDSAADIWTPASLHNAMELHYSMIGGTWPRWDMWGFLAGGRFENSGVAGIMFDAGAAYGGAGEPPERQGYAVFRNHSWFTNLTAAAPANDAQRTARRTYLYTYVHEAGHAFNLLHSWNKGRPDSRSWMNYPHNIAGFYNTFYFRFDDEELIHIRHGDRAAVIMGGDAWATGTHIEDSSLGEISSIDGDPPIELTLRGKPFFDFMEPVMLEVRLRNLLPGVPLSLDSRLEPQYGVVAFLIQRPDGRFVEHDPIYCAVGDSETVTLNGSGAEAGEDRFSKLVQLAYGKHGFSFSEPGEYRVRAFYRTEDGFVYPSNVHRLRIGQPASSEQDRVAQDFFSREVGLALALQDARSPFLKKGMDQIDSLMDREKGSAVAAAVGMLMAGSHQRAFIGMETAKSKLTAKPTVKANPKRALELTAGALSLLTKDKEKSANLPLRQVVEVRAQALTETGQTPQAKKEVASLRTTLQGRGVNESVLKSILSFEKSL